MDRSGSIAFGRGVVPTFDGKRRPKYRSEPGSGSRMTRGRETRSTEKRMNFEAQILPQLEDLYRTALYLAGNEAGAQELVQESFARAYHSWHKYQFCHNRRVWLFGIMVNALLNRHRLSASPSEVESNADDVKDYSARSLSGDLPAVEDSGHVHFSWISGDDVKKAVRNLPFNFRLVVVLSLQGGFSYQEIADIAGITLETAKSRLHQGRKLLQRELFDHVGCEGMYDMPAGRVRSDKSE